MTDFASQAFNIGPIELLSTSDETDKKTNAKFRKYNIQYAGDSPSVCPNCGGILYSHGKRSLKVIDTPNFGYPSVLELKYPRKRCPECGYIWQPTFENVDKKRNMTDRALKDIAQRSLRNTFDDVCNDYILDPKTVRNVFVDYVNENAEKLRFKTPAFLGIDEIKVKKLGELTVITDLEHKTLFDILQGRNQADLTDYFSKLPDADKVLWVCSDMYRPFQRTISFAMPNALWAIDHFHVVMKANEAVDTVRRIKQNDMPKKKRVQTKRGLAYTLKTRERDLTSEEAQKIKLLRDDDELRPLAIAFDLKEDFFNIYDNNPYSKENAQVAFVTWENSIPEDEIYDKFRDLANTVHNFWEQIFAYWDCPIAISNGYTECTNRLIRENNMRGRGYSFEILRARTLYRKTNIKAILEKDLMVDAIGPSIPSSGPIFHFEPSSLNEDVEDDSYEPFPDHDEQIDYDPITGEIIE